MRAFIWSMINTNNKLTKSFYSWFNWFVFQMFCNNILQFFETQKISRMCEKNSLMLKTTILNNRWIWFISSRNTHWKSCESKSFVLSIRLHFFVIFYWWSWFMISSFSYNIKSWWKHELNFSIIWMFDIIVSTN